MSKVIKLEKLAVVFMDRIAEGQTDLIDLYKEMKDLAEGVDETLPEPAPTMKAPELPMPPVEVDPSLPPATPDWRNQTVADVAPKKQKV